MSHRITAHPTVIRLFRDTMNSGAATNAEGSHLAAIVRLQDVLFTADPAGTDLPYPASLWPRLDPQLRTGCVEVPDDKRLSVDVMTADLGVLREAWKAHKPNLLKALASYLIKGDEALEKAEEIPEAEPKHEAA